MSARETGLDGCSRAPYEVTEESRFKEQENELAALIVPWTTDAEAVAIARDHGLPTDLPFIEAARASMRSTQVDPYRDSRGRMRLLSVCLHCGGPLLRDRASHKRCDTAARERGDRGEP